MSYQEAREAFVVRMAQEGVTLDVARKLLFESSTLHRLNVAECNADYPYNTHRDCRAPDCKCFKGTLADCAACGQTMPAPDLVGDRCSMCRAEARVTALVAPLGIAPVFTKDPGPVPVKLQVPSGATDDVAGEGLCVPAREVRP